MTADIAHELRTPLTIIKGYAEMLQGLPGASAIVEKILHSCNRMERMINKLLMLADLEHLPERQRSDIAELTNRAVEQIGMVYPAAQIVFEKGQDQVVAEVDPDLLELALMNLFENGIKYSSPPAHLTIELKKAADEVCLTVQDRGIGIPEAHLPHIFDRFYAVDKRLSRRLGGAGLGLSLVKTIIEKHQGKISVDSVPGQGTTFTVVLPQKNQEESGLGESVEGIHR